MSDSGNMATCSVISLILGFMLGALIAIVMGIVAHGKILRSYAGSGELYEFSDEVYYRIERIQQMYLHKDGKLYPDPEEASE